MITAGSLADRDAPADGPRALARRLGVSPTTVSEAWRSLADVGAIEARGRNGTFVRQPTGPGGPRRYRRVTEGPGHFALDLSSGTPDPALLPDLGPVVARVEPPVADVELPRPPGAAGARGASCAERWPFPPEALTVVDGAMDALDRVAQVRAAPRRSGRRRAPDVPAAARPARPARLRGDRRRRRRRGARRSTGSRDALRTPATCAVPAAARPQPDRRRD